RPQRRLLSARVSRSQSFAGVLGSHERGPRSFPVFSPPGPPRKPPALSRVSRMFSVAHPAAKVPQPERLDLVYTALKRGLTAYLEVHQQEQEKLQGQIRESKRNSRLGFLYDLDKSSPLNASCDDWSSMPARSMSCMRHTVSSGVSGMVPTTWSVPTPLGPRGAERPGTAWQRPLGGIESTRRACVCWRASWRHSWASFISE
ncbi:RIPOR1 isoform 14, partial [Pongo abelii]